MAPRKPQKPAYSETELGDLKLLMIEVERQGQELTLQLETSEVMTTAKTVSSSEKPIYKKATIMGGQEFTLAGTRLGSTQQMIFLLKPMDMQPYDLVEIDEKKAFETFPLLVDAFKGLPGFAEFDNADEPTAVFKRHLTFYLAYHAEQRLEAARKAEEEKQAAERSTLDFYAGNEMVGMF